MKQNISLSFKYNVKLYNMRCSIDSLCTFLYTTCTAYVHNGGLHGFTKTANVSKSTTFSSRSSQKALP